MRIFRRPLRFLPRRPPETPRSAALAEARKATARLRRANAKAQRRQAGKQANPANDITAGPWMGGGD